MAASSLKKPPKFLYSWQDFDQDIKFLYANILASKWIPEYIVGVKRGGLIPAIKLSHLLNKPMVMMSCQLRDFTDNSIKLLEAEYLPKNQNILIVDDICDSGDTLSQIIIAFMQKGHYSLKTSALFYNTEQSFFVDYKARSLNRTKQKDWIVFPWEI